MKFRMCLVLPLAVFMCAVAVSAYASLPTDEDIDVPFTKFVLDNGLRLIVHEDRKAPIVAFNLFFHVGSKDEPAGRTGFAHLFEHLMFQGSENFQGEHLRVFEEIGASGFNGTTGLDLTNFFAVVPVSALDTLLWLESDRAAHLLGSISQAKLDEQRGVVKNEKRQYENQPYGKFSEILQRAMFPPEHPYSHTVIGLMEDLDAATLDDVKEWFSTNYGAANAVLTLSGDIDADTAKEKVNHYFGEMPPGPPLTKLKTWIPRWQGHKRGVHHDRAPNPIFYRAWNIPMEGADLERLRLAGDILGGSSDRTSRLHKRLVQKDGLAISVHSGAYGHEVCGQFFIEVKAPEGGDISAIEAAVEDELARFLSLGPTRDELDRVRGRMMSDLTRRLERVAGKAALLARNEVMSGNPHRYKESLAFVREATPRNLRGAARTWLKDSSYTLETYPYPELKAAPMVADRSAMPPPGPPPNPVFPAVERAELGNGLKIVFARREGAPVAEFGLLVNGGTSADGFRRSGTADLVSDLMDEGTQRRTGVELSEALMKLGARLSSGAGLDVSVVSLSALRANLKESFDLFAEVVLRPAFPLDAFERRRKERLDRIRSEAFYPRGIVSRLMPYLVFGENHAYASPPNGRAEVVERLTRDDVVSFYRTWFRPGNATLVAAGDLSLDEVRRMAESGFGRWKDAAVPAAGIGDVPERKKPIVYLIDRPDSLQSTLAFAATLPPTSNSDQLALIATNDVLGNMASSRLNMNLREDKNWTYGAYSSIRTSRGPQMLSARTDVQADKTREALIEMAREFRDIVESRPVTEEELGLSVTRRTVTLPGSWETVGSVRASLDALVRFGRPDDYYATYPEKVRALSLEEVRRSAAHLDPNRLVWIVVGDVGKIGDAVRAAGLGEVRVMDADGAPKN